MLHCNNVYRLYNECHMQKCMAAIEKDYIPLERAARISSSR
jgi:hypothetical protein